jgi:hypothetical protein
MRRLPQEQPFLAPATMRRIDPFRPFKIIPVKEPPTRDLVPMAASIRFIDRRCTQLPRALHTIERSDGDSRPPRKCREEHVVRHNFA